ncbi:amino acid adenylation domain-containing protein [Corallococcus terminator]
MSKFSDRILNAKARASTAALQKETPSRKAILPSADRGNRVPLSSAQRRLWFLDRLEPGRAQYNVPIFVRLQGPLDERALSASLNKLMERHESLRTCFTTLQDDPHQDIAPALSLELHHVDLGPLPADAREQRIRDLAGEESRKPFELSQAPLVRATLIRAEEEDHVLLLSMHHIVSDGWSMAVFFFELGAYYSAMRLGTEPSLQPLRLQYADFALWHNEWLRGEAFREQLDYWKHQLAGAPPLLMLPTDHPRPTVKRNQGAARRFAIPVEELSALRRVSREEKATLFMTVLSLFKVLLGRYSGQSDISVGTPIANRNRPELEGLIGFFVNTLVLRTNLTGAPSFRQVLRQVREVSLQAFGHQDIPFEHVVEALHPERNLGHNPLFQVMFSLQESATASAALEGLSVTALPVETGTSKFDLLMSLEETPSGLTGELEYDTDLFDAATIERMLGHFQTLLTAAVQQPDTAITALPLLSDTERRQLLVDWNATSTDFPRRQCIHELFSAQASATPDALALRFGDDGLTYAQLEAQANQLAWHLQSLGVVPDTLVGLYLERSPSLIVSMLACLKAGGAYLPLDTSYPPERLALMLRDSRAPLLITSRALSQSLSLPSDVRLLELEAESSAISQLPTHAPDSAATPANLAYAIYTSGSTGQPKGIAVPHLGVVRLVRDSDYVQLSPADSVAQVSNASFDAATFEIWGALLNGARLVGIPRDVSLSPSLFAARLREEAISTLFLTTALFNQIAHHSPSAFATLSSVLFGGELVDPDVVRSVLLHGPPSRLLHVYGPTENTTFSTWHLISSPPPPLHTVPIGKPLSNSSCFILDDSLQPLPLGVPGQLYVGGDGLARGYLHQPELTASRFISNPFSPDSRLYKTGDVARFLPDGSIEFLGRQDNQVKLRGFRIELGEVEAALLRHPSLNDCVVLAREDSPGSRRLVAYFSSSSPPSGSELRDFLKRSLPDYMLPAVFVCLPSLPLSPNGKVDRKALPPPDDSLSSSTSFLPPRSPLEELLSNLWAQLLGLPRVGVLDNFFDLGGHSLLATQLVSRIRETLRVELPLRHLFSSPTVASLARVLSDSLSGPHSSSPISPAPRDSLLPLSFAQQRLWLIDQLQPGSAAYNVPLAIHLSGDLSLSSLQRALDSLIERHEALRTSFALHDGQPFQLIATSLSLPLTCVDLRHLSDEERTQRLSELSKETAEQPFDLSRGPLVRAALLRPEEREHILLLTMHHIVSDGWSMDVLFRELSALYAAFVRDEPSPLAPLPIQYVDFSVWQREWLHGERLDSQLSYWKQQLAGAPPFLPLPTDFPRPAAQSFRGAVASRDLPRPLLDSLKRLSQQESTTLFMTLLAGFQLLLRRYSGQEDISVGTPIANRNRAELEGLIGFFVNSLVMRTDVSGTPSFRELLRRVREVALGAYAHQDVPFDQVVEALQPERDPSYSPLFQVMFALQSGVAQPPTAAGLSMESREVRTATSKFDLLLATVESPEGLHCAVEYNTDLFSAATIERMLGHFETLLSAAARQPDSSVTSLPLLSDTERRQLLVDWNATSTDFPRRQCIHELFSAQASATPDALALRFGDDGLTYAQLEAQANQLAWHLQSLGVVPDTLVGLYLERSPSLIVSMLACLKAGGAYLPLDTSYPPERLALMLRDSRAPLLITSRALSQSLSLPSDVRLLELEAESSAISQLPTHAPDSAATPANLAYAIYTSGSTGQPKGIAVPHLGVVRLVRDSDYVQLSPADSVAQVSNASFDAATFEIWGALLNGARLVGIPRDVSLSPSLFAARLREEAISTLFLTTALFNQIAHHSPSAFATLSSVLFGGELVDPDVVRSVLLHGPPSRLLHVYGPTENTTFSTWHLISSPPPPLHTVPIGKPLSNSSCFILDDSLQPLPLGVPGQLYVGGDGLARGYLHQPELTASRFISNPFSPDSRLYKTGDVARFLPDGSIEFLGRQDNQVKLRGFRIELGEVEAALLRHPALNDCVVLAREDAPGARRLVAYFSSSSPPSGSELRDFLKRSLPDYMLPAVFVCLPSLPLSPNGKVDRKALPPPDDSLSHSDSFLPPRSPLEELLSNLWAQLLGLPRVGVLDNFFDLGGHSLLATQLVSRIRETLRVELPLRHLFSSPTVASLARVLSDSLSGPHASSPISPSSRDSLLPLSFAQQRLWLIDQLQPGSAAYNVPLAIHLSGDLSLSSLQRTLDSLVERHEALRTSFALHNGQPFQLIATSLSLPLPLIDLSANANASEQVLTLATEEAARPFDLARGPLIRAALLRTAPRHHVLLLTMHHIVSDGWSMDVLFRELSALYTAFSNNQPATLAPLPIQYADFSVWQREWLHGERLDAQLSYWKQQLAGAPPVLELPTDFPRPSSQSLRGAVESLTLPLSLLDSLKRLSRQEGTTLFMTLLAGFQLMLSRYSGQEDISVGTAIANRNRAELEGLIGFFVNSLVMRTQLSGAPSFRELLRRVREVALGAYAHQDVPFEQVVEALQVPRDARYSPLFQVRFNLQDSPYAHLKMAGLDLSVLETEWNYTKFDLHLFMSESAEGLQASFAYSTDLFKPDTIRRMLGHLGRLLEGLAATPDQPITAVPMLTDPEVRQLSLWNAATLLDESSRCFHTRFEQQAQATPESTALVFEDHSLTYRQLNERANRLAWHLQSLGVGPDHVVGLYLERSLDLLVGLLAILKAGGAYLPMDPGLPQERLAFMMSDLRLGVLLTQESLRASLPANEAHVLCLDTLDAQLATRSSENPISTVGPEHLVYVIYTSGSTGKPKGVGITHGNLGHYLAGISRVLDVPSGLRYATVSTFAADLGNTMVFPALASGGALHVISDERSANPESMAEYMHTRRIDCLKIVPSHLTALLTASRPEQVLPRQRLVLGGEASRWELMERVRALAPDCRVINHYGPTETTIGVLTWAVPPSLTDKPATTVPLGFPIGNTTTHVLDAHLRPVPVGVPGELFVGGPGVTRGYLGRPELTAERFVRLGGERVYRTGDVVRRLSDGALEFLGRIDNQVKLRGFRIELGEVEAILCQQPEVRDAVVLAREDLPGTKRLVAYLVPHAGQDLSTEPLRERLSHQMPEYMVPSVFVVLEALPLTPNGKVDRKALPAPTAPAAPSESTSDAPHSPTELLLADIWKQVLRVEHVSPGDNFFKLGGDSILSIMVVAKAIQAGLQLTPIDILECQSLAELAARVRTPASESGESVSGALPLTPIQSRFFELYPTERHHWNQAFLFEVHQRLSPARMEEAAGHLMRHHDALRLRFSQGATGWEQTYAPADVAVPFSHHDLSALPDAERLLEQERLATVLQRSLDLTEGPLLRVAHFDWGTEQPGRLLLIIHHLATDGISWRVLMEDLQTLWEQLGAGKEPRLPPKSTSYQEWARRLAEYAQSEAAHQQLRAWRPEVYREVAPIPRDLPDGRNLEGSTRLVEASLTQEETRVLLYRMRDVHGVNVDHVLLAALVRALTEWTGRASHLLELDNHGRESILEGVELSRSVGWFTALSPVVVRAPEGASAPALLQSVREQLQAVPDRGVGFGILRYLSQDTAVREQLSRLPRTEVCFNYLGHFDLVRSGDAPLRPSSEPIGPERGLDGPRSRVLDITAYVSEGTFHLVWAYSENLHRRETMERLSSAYLTNLRALLATVGSAGGL